MSKKRSSATIKAEIEKLQNELEESIRYEEDLKSGDTKALAIALHEHLCRHNHTDGCGWHYEVKDGKHDWTGGDHIYWFQKAEKFIERFGTDNILEKIEMISFF